MITAERLRHVVSYAPETGLFYWRNPTALRIKVGAEAGCPGAGYMRIGIDGRLYLSHRLAWLYVNGAWPVDQIDHINGNSLDNRIENLRESTQFQNVGNMRVHTRNTSGIKGVSFNKARGKWVANIARYRKVRYLGCFDSKEHAAEAYAIAARAQWGEFARLA